MQVTIFSYDLLVETKLKCKPKIMNKKKILLTLSIIVIIIGYFGYKYVFRGPRDVSSESAEFTITAKKLKSEFTSNQNKANTKYIGKTIIVYGKVTEKNKNSITLDNGVIGILSATANNSVNLNSNTKIKGKVDGYDDLFEQVKLTESSVVNK